jgi:hypothetical protein
MDLAAYLVNDDKVYVDVNLDHLADGKLVPLSFIWEDGTKYEIDRIIDVRQAASLKAGGTGLRFTIYVKTKKTFLWLEEDAEVLRWFMERK